jgi:hypothetical protein
MTCTRRTLLRALATSPIVTSCAHRPAEHGLAEERHWHVEWDGADSRNGILVRRDDGSSALDVLNDGNRVYAQTVGQISTLMVRKQRWVLLRREIPPFEFHLVYQNLSRDWQLLSLRDSQAGPAVQGPTRIVDTQRLESIVGAIGDRNLARFIDARRAAHPAPGYLITRRDGGQYARLAIGTYDLEAIPLNDQPLDRELAQILRDLRHLVRSPTPPGE